MEKRLVIPVEFRKSKEDDVELYELLMSFSNPAAIIKDILKGKLPLSILRRG